MGCFVGAIGYTAAVVAVGGQNALGDDMQTGVLVSLPLGGILGLITGGLVSLLINREYWLAAAFAPVGLIVAGLFGALTRGAWAWLLPILCWAAGFIAIMVTGIVLSKREIRRQR